MTRPICWRRCRLRFRWASARSDAFHRARDREHQRSGDQSCNEAQGQARSQDWKGLKFAIPFDFSNHNYLLRYYLAENGIDPDQDVQLRSCRRRKWSRTCAPTTSMASSPPTISASARSSTASASSTCCRRKCGTDIPAALRGLPGVHHEIAEHLCRALRAIMEASAYSSKAENRKEIAEAIAPANYLNPPVTRARAGADRHLRRRPWRHQEGPEARTFDPFP